MRRFFGVVLALICVSVFLVSAPGAWAEGPAALHGRFAYLGQIVWRSTLKVAMVRVANSNEYAKVEEKIRQGYFCDYASNITYRCRLSIERSEPELDRHRARIDRSFSGFWLDFGQSSAEGKLLSESQLLRRWEFSQIVQSPVAQSVRYEWLELLRSEEGVSKIELFKQHQAEPWLRLVRYTGKPNELRTWVELREPTSEGFDVHGFEVIFQ